MASHLVSVSVLWIFVIRISNIAFCSSMHQVEFNNKDVYNSSSSEDAIDEYRNLELSNGQARGIETWKMTRDNATVMELLPVLDEKKQNSWKNIFYFEKRWDKVTCNVSTKYFNNETLFKFEFANGTISDAYHLNDSVIAIDTNTNTVSKTSSIQFLDKSITKLLCLAQGINSTTWANVSQTVLVKPSFAAKLKEKFNQTIIAPNEKHNLTCTAEGIPTPTFEWYKIVNGTYKKEVHEGIHGEVNDTITSILEVHLSEIENSSVEYECEASNDLGIAPDSRFFTITRRRPNNAGSSTFLPIISTAVAACILIGVCIRWTLIWFRHIQDQKTEIPIGQLVISDQPLARNGHFGLIFQAELKPSGTKVVVKKLREPANRNDYSVHLFREELAIFKRVGKHPNIVQYIGCVTKNQVPAKYMIIMKCYEQGDLQKFLIKNKPTTMHQQLNGYEDCNTNIECVVYNITSLQMIKWCRQIACGMEYLANKRIVHGDLAARNILLHSVNDEIRAVITDFGLSKELLKNDDGTYAYKSTGRTLPVALCSIEVLKDFVYSEDSDIWAFGVLMYEIFSYGQVPYKTELRDYLEEMDRLKNESEEVSSTRELLLEFLQSERRLSQPEAANDTIYEIMKSSWIEEPEKRPRFTELKKKFEDVLIKIGASSYVQVKVDFDNASVVHNCIGQH